MPVLNVQIIRLTDDHQPGWVECEFTDAAGHPHQVQDKAPIFGANYWDLKAALPARGLLGCELLARWRDSDGHELARITIARPDGVESTKGLAEFVVLADQLVI